MITKNNNKKDTKKHNKNTFSFEKKIIRFYLIGSIF